MRSKALGLAVVAMLALAGCGNRGALKPVAGEAAPPKAYGSTASPSADALLTPPPQTRPTRSDEVLRNAEQRRSDDFDLPPQN